jgi:hypothetical protein
MHFVRKLALILAAVSLPAACGGSEPGDGSGNSTGGTSATGGSNATGSTTGNGGNAGAPISIGDLLPWKEGNSWTYRVTDDAGISTVKKTTVGPLELVGGTGPNKDRMANKVTTHKDDTGDGAELDETVSWQAREGESVVRYREQAFGRTTKALELEEHWTPRKLHVDSSAEHTAINASWLEVYTETKLPAGATPIYDAPASDRWFVDRREMVTVPAGTFDALVLRKVSVAASQKTYWYAPGVGKVKETGGQTEELLDYELK